MDVSVIMVNYNTREMTAAAIDSVFEKTTGVDFEVILVDNASTDGSREQFANDSRIKYFYLEENIGFGQANNYGVKNGASGKYVFFLNTDTLLISNIIKVFFDYISSNENIGILGCNLLNASKEPAYSFSRLFPGIVSDINLLTNGLLNKFLFNRNTNFNYSRNPVKVAYISGADLFIEKQLFTEIDGFSANYFMYYEETDLCLQSRKQGKKAINLPYAAIIHLEGGSQKCINRDSLINKEKRSIVSRATFFKRNHSPIYRFIEKGLYCTYLLLCGIKYRDYNRFRILRQEYCRQLKIHV